MENLAILNYLKEKNFQLHLTGTRYLAYMIERYRPGDPITKYLYPVCGKAYGIPWRNVERACRTAIADAWKGKGPAPCASEVLAVAYYDLKGESMVA